MTIAGLTTWVENRGQISEAHHNIADLLNTAKTGPLASQSGKTADALVQLFDEGEQLAREVARKNGVKKDSYSAALSSVHNLRDKLSEIADRYNQEINKILESKEPAPIKIPQIMEAITQGQQEANLAAAGCGGDISDAGQRILAQENGDQSFRQFASANGIDMSQMFRSRDPQTLEATVKGLMGASEGASGGGVAGGGAVPAGMNPGAAGGGGAVPAGMNPGAAGGGGAVPAGMNPGAAGGGGAVSAGMNPGGSRAAFTPAGFGTSVGSAPASPPPTPPPGPGSTVPLSATHSVGSSPAAPAVGAGLQPVGTATHDIGRSPVAPLPNASAVGSATHDTGFSPPPSSSAASGLRFSPAISGGAPPSMLNPANVGINPGSASGGLSPSAFQGSIAPPSMPPPDFSRHMDAGLMSQGTGAVPPSAPVAPQVAPTPVSPTTAPTAGSGDWHSSIPAAQSSVAQAAAPSYSAPAASPAVNTSAPSSSGYMTSAPSMSAPPPSYSGGALPSYGSDLRPPTVSAPAGSPSPPPAVTSPPPLSGSPSTTPTAGTGGGGVGPAAVARPDSAPSMPQQPAPMGIAGKAVAASAVGAVAGAASADATARIRLQRIVDAVARQEPRLAWAIGDRADDTTVLVTDLADGWIPPGIDIPSVATLLEPERRRGDLESLLGEVKLAVNHTPDRYVPEADEPVPTSPRPRCAPEIEELGWELSSATLWRDGLPRLAHTLAKAASSGTGVDPSEVELLQQQMHDVGERVLDAYPDQVDPKDVGNWQLLAAIDALVRGDKVAANYHLAWFRASMASTTAQH